MRESDTVGRWGGDEFVVFMEHVDRASVGEMVAKVRQVVELPTNYAQQQFSVGASIGLAFAPDDGSTLEELLRAADSRMYENKALRREDSPRDAI